MKGIGQLLASLVFAVACWFVYAYMYYLLYDVAILAMASNAIELPRINYMSFVAIMAIISIIRTGRDTEALPFAEAWKKVFLRIVSQFIMLMILAILTLIIF